MKQTIQLTVNGYEWEVDVEPRQLLVDVLRDQLGLRGAKCACQDSYCGACTVLLDGKAVHSCCVLAIAVRGQTFDDFTASTRSTMRFSAVIMSPSPALPV